MGKIKKVHQTNYHSQRMMPFKISIFDFRELTRNGQCQSKRGIVLNQFLVFLKKGFDFN
jgi:hypothetical protein